MALLGLRVHPSAFLTCHISGAGRAACCYAQGILDKNCVFICICKATSELWTAQHY